MGQACACICAHDGGEDYAAIYKETFPAAKKTYKCCECGGEIKAGEKYHCVTGLWDGVWATYRTCMPCNRIRDHYCQGRDFVITALRGSFFCCFGFDYCGQWPDAPEV